MASGKHIPAEDRCYNDDESDDDQQLIDATLLEELFKIPAAPARGRATDGATMAGERREWNGISLLTPTGMQTLNAGNDEKGVLIDADPGFESKAGNG
jgi:hypothetical protein